MKLDELIDIFIKSKKEDWQIISTWGHGSGPSYKNQFQFSEVYDGESNVLSHTEHSNVASYKYNLSITIAWGLRSGDEDGVVDRPWARNNSDPSPGKAKFLDFFFNNALVFRTSYCVVDGGRCEIPFPEYDADGNISVASQYHDAIKKLSELNGSSYFDNYFNSTGITINNDKWIE